MGRLALIDVLSAAVLLAFWYICFTRYNRQKGAMALRRVQAACAGRATLSEARWFGGSRLQAHLRFASHWVADARITVSLLPRQIPLRWLVSLWRKQKETLTFEANLDAPPGFQLEVFRHRWLTQNNLDTATSKSRKWTVSRPGPVVLTTRTQWGQELTPLVNTLMSSQGHKLLSVRFRAQSPHLSATVALEDFSDQETSEGLLDVLRELAADASTSRQ